MSRRLDTAALRSLPTDIAGLDVTPTSADQSGSKDCTGDASTWGQSGIEINSPGNSVPGTDPTLSANPGHFTTERTRYFSRPDFPLAGVPALETRARTPIAVTVG